MRERVCVCVCVSTENRGTTVNSHTVNVFQKRPGKRHNSLCAEPISLAIKSVDTAGVLNTLLGLTAPGTDLRRWSATSIPPFLFPPALLLLQCGSPHVHWIDWDGDIEERSESGEMSDECRSGFVVESPLGAGVQGGVAAAGGVVDRVRCLVDMCEGEGGGNSEHMAGVLQQVLEGIRSTLALLPEDACSEDWESLSIQGLRCLEAGIRWSVS